MENHHRDRRPPPVGITMLSAAVMLTCVMSALPLTSAAPSMDVDSTSGAARIPPSSVGHPMSSAELRKQIEPALLIGIQRRILDQINHRQPIPSVSPSSADDDVDDDASPLLQTVPSLDSLPPSLTAMIRGESLRLGGRNSSSSSSSSSRSAGGGGHESSPATSSGHRHQHRVQQSKNLEQRHQRPNHRQQQGNDDERGQSADGTGTGSRRSSSRQRTQHQQQKPHSLTKKSRNGGGQSHRKESKAERDAPMTTEIISTAETVFNATEEGLVQFRLIGSEHERLRPNGNGNRKSTMQVTAAAINVLLRPRSSTIKRQANGGGGGSAGAGGDAGRRLGIKIYALDRRPASVGNDDKTDIAAASPADWSSVDADFTSTQDRAPLEIVDAAATAGTTPYDSAGVVHQQSPSSVRIAQRPHRAFPTSFMPLAQLQLTAPRRRRHAATWHTLLLPTTFVQDALDSRRSSPPVLRLQIVCDGCEAAGRELVVGEMASASPSSVPVDADNNGKATAERRRRGPPDAAGDRRTADGSRGNRGRTVGAEATSTAPYLVIQVKRGQNNNHRHGYQQPHKQQQQQQLQQRGLRRQHHRQPHQQNLHGRCPVGRPDADVRC